MIMSTSITFLDQHFNANYVDIKGFSTRAAAQGGYKTHGPTLSPIRRESFIIANFTHFFYAHSQFLGKF